MNEVNAILLSADRLWDGTGQATSARPWLRVADGRIVGIEKGLLQPSACSGERRDFLGCTILPGLIDTHVHLVMAALESNEAIIAQVGRETDAELTARIIVNAQAALRAGITTVRDCGGKGRLVQDVRDRIRRGEVEGADILSCGMPITTTLGHCHWLGLIADSHAEVQRAAERMLAESADFLKVMATGGNMTPTSDPMKAQFGPEELRLIADLGRRANLHSAAHVLSQAALPSVIAANYQTIEHCDWRVEEWRYEFKPELAERIRDQQQFVGLTMSGTTRRAFMPEMLVNPTPPVQRLDLRFACERRMIDAGVRFTLHSDAGVKQTPIESFELGLRTAQIELKLTPHEILQAVTRTAAQAIGLSDRGTLVPGQRADLIVVEGDPLRDLACLGKVRAVMKAGRWVRIP